tara:strand:- start:1521 stop:1844 length:324 start_codon:yes stop_codon:yes gene_type:complete
MNSREEAYIGIELETHIYGQDLGSAGMDDVLHEGIDISAERLYRFIYENGWCCSDEKLKMMLDDYENSNNMLYPLTCHYHRETSYADWLEYFKDREEQKKRKESENG